jgi:hypothetical protein
MCDLDACDGRWGGLERIGWGDGCEVALKLLLNVIGELSKSTMVSLHQSCCPRSLSFIRLVSLSACALPSKVIGWYLAVAKHALMIYDDFWTIPSI